MRKQGIVMIVTALLIFCSAPVFAQQDFAEDRLGMDESKSVAAPKGDVGQRLDTLEKKMQSWENRIGSWSLFGRIQMFTVWQDNSTTSVVPAKGLYPAPEMGGDRELRFDLGHGSRFGGSFTRSNFKAVYEIGYDDSKGETKRDDVYTRCLYGLYKLNKETWILIGQYYTPSTTEFLMSTSMGHNDGQFLMFQFYNDRQAQITLQYRNFRIGFVKPHAAKAEYVLGFDKDDADVDLFFPKIEANYTYYGEKWVVSLSGGYQRFTIEQDLLGKHDIESYAVGTAGQIYFGPVSLAASVYTAKNHVQYGIGTPSIIFGTALFITGIDNGQIKDSHVTAGCLVATYTPSPAITFEAGVGYSRETSNQDFLPEPDETIGYYIKANIPWGKYITFQPEVGYCDFVRGFNGEGQGRSIYGGFKTEVLF